MSRIFQTLDAVTFIGATRKPGPARCRSVEGYLGCDRCVLQSGESLRGIRSGSDADGAREDNKVLKKSAPLAGPATKSASIGVPIFLKPSSSAIVSRRRRRPMSWRASIRYAKAHRRAASKRLFRRVCLRFGIFFNAIGMANFHDCRLCCDKGPAGRLSSDPFSNWDGKAAFTLERSGFRQDSRAIRVKPFAEALLYFHFVRQRKGDFCHFAVKKWRASFEPMRHQQRSSFVSKSFGSQSDSLSPGQFAGVCGGETLRCLGRIKESRQLFGSIRNKPRPSRMPFERSVRPPCHQGRSWLRYRPYPAKSSSPPSPQRTTFNSCAASRASFHVGKIA